MLRLLSRANADLKKVFDQLALQVEFVQKDVANGMTSIVFELNHGQTESDTSRKRLHRLAMDESQSDLRPPAGITALLLEQLDLRLEVIRIGDLEIVNPENEQLPFDFHDQDELLPDDEPEFHESEDEVEDKMLEELLFEANQPALQSPIRCARRRYHT